MNLPSAQSLVDTAFPETAVLENETSRPTAEEIAAALIRELKRTGRLRGHHGVVVFPESAFASVGCIVRTGGS